MYYPDIEGANDWLYSINPSNPQPNMINETSEQGTVRAWAHPFRGDQYIYYESGQVAGLPTEMYIGVLAVAELEGLGKVEAEDVMLGSASSRVVDRKSVQGLLADLMGLPHSFAKESNQLAPVRYSEADHIARAGLVVDRFSQLSGLSEEEVETLSLSAFRNQPINKPGDKFVYLVAADQINTKYGPQVPAIRYDQVHKKWQFRLIEPYILSGFFAVKDEIKVKTIGGQAHWSAIDEIEIKQLSLGLEETVKSDSL